MALMATAAYPFPHPDSAITPLYSEHSNDSLRGAPVPTYSTKDLQKIAAAVGVKLGAVGQ
jgi:hypothetical protein